MKVLLRHSGPQSHIVINGRTFPLQTFKDFLIRHYPHLVSRFFVRPVTRVREGVEVRRTPQGRELSFSGAATEFHYDWGEIVDRCSRSLFPLHHFLTLNS